MSSGYKYFVSIHSMTAGRRACFTVICLLTIQSLKAQNVTSPYSILGIGDVDARQPGRYFISGNTALARRDPWAYNASNPASISALPFKTMNFDVFMRGKVSTFLVPEADTATSPTKDFIVRRVSMAFKVSNTTGIAFGLQPYSAINYKFHETGSVADGTTSYDKAIDGSGGINRVYFSVGKSVGKRLSVGVTANYLFGSLQRTTQYTNSYLNIRKQEYDFYWGGLFEAGVQYYSSAGKRWQQRLGATLSVSTRLRGQLQTEYIENNATIQKTIDDGREFKLPVSAGLGYSATHRNGLTLSVEGELSKWPYQKVDYTNSYSYPVMRASAGLEYSFKNKQVAGLETGFLAFGLTSQNYYIRIRDKPLWDYSASLGGGINVARPLAVYAGIEIGKKGNKNTGQIQERYTQFVFGITLKDIWIGPKFKKYD